MLNIKYTALLFVALLYLPILVYGQPENFPNRKLEIEKYTKEIYLIKEFRWIADSLQMSVSELCDYPVIFPIKNPVVSSGYGLRKHPIYKVQKFHAGIDFVETKGASVYATGNGIIVRKGYNSGYGNYIEIQHAGGFQSLYAHLSEVFVNVGDSVRIGKRIACVGNTGLATGNHLHYEVRKGKNFLNPAEWCYCLFKVLKSK